MRRAWIGLGLLAAGCDVHPVTGDRGLALISLPAELAIGRAGAPEVVAALGAHPGASLQAYVNRVGQSVAEAAAVPERTWEFTVVEDASVNAFALPGGFIFVTRGLLSRLGSEAELAAVLGHEIAHVTARHALRRLHRQQLPTAQLGIDAAVSSLVHRLAPRHPAALDLLLLQYSRENETEADRLGFGYAATQGWDARRMRGLLAMLQRDAFARGIRPTPVWLATHPDPGDRMRAVDRLVQTSAADFASLRVGIAEYFAEIDGLVYGDDPRDGYFDGSLFVHPALAYRIRFPKGWALHHGSQVVTAVSPAGDAVLEFRGVFGPLDAAVGHFAGQPGLRVLAQRALQIQGLAAVQATFAAQQDDASRVQGVVTFVQHGAATWRVVGFALPARFSTAAPTFAQAGESFAPLADQRALAVQPQRIRITRTPRAMTLGEFSTEFPSSVSIEELAMLNGLTSTSTLAAGRLLKRVVGTRRLPSAPGH